MDIYTTISLFGMASPSGDGSSQAPGWAGMVPILLMVFVFYFIFIRPQQKKARELQALVSTLRSGDKVLTSSGIVGIVVGVKENTVSIRSADTKLELMKSAVSEITERGGSDA